MTPGIAPSPDAIQFLAIGMILVLGKIGILSYIADTVAAVKSRAENRAE